MFIFLDIDGVLNREQEWTVPYTLNKECLDNFATCFKEEAVKIILISSWRSGFISPNNAKNLPQIKKLEAELSQRGLRISGITSVSEKNRLKGILEFVKKHPDSYIILDDDRSEYDAGVVANLHLVNCKYGFSLKDIKAIQKLMRSEN